MRIPTTCLPVCTSGRGHVEVDGMEKTTTTTTNKKDDFSIVVAADRAVRASSAASEQRMYTAAEHVHFLFL